MFYFLLFRTAKIVFFSQVRTVSTIKNKDGIVRRDDKILLRAINPERRKTKKTWL